ncbi:PDZ domain-containing protein [Novosphingobium panipatense]
MGIEHNKGEFIQLVEPDGPAARAGLKAGDVVVKVDNKEVTRDQTLSYIVANIAPGARIPVEVIRNGKRQTLSATVAKRPSEEDLSPSFDTNPEQDGDAFNNPPQQQENGVVEKSLGLTVTPLTPQIARQLGAAEGTRGVVIVAVDPNSDAGQKGLQRGFIILQAGGRPVTTQAELAAAIAAAKAEGRTALLVRVQPRGQQATFVPLRLR